MSARRYSEDGVIASIIHYIISGVFFIAGTVFFVFTMNGEYEYSTAFYAIFWGLAFVNLSHVKAIYEDYDISNKFVRFLLGFATVVGVFALLGGVVVSANETYPLPYVKVLAFSIVIGTVLKVFVQNVNEFIPAFDNPESDFFKYHSWLIFVAATLAFFSVMYIFFDVYFTLLLVGNWMLVYFIFTSFRTWMESRKAGSLVCSIIFFVIGIALNLPIALAVNNVSNLSSTINDANLFNLASNLYFALSIVMGIGFTFLTRLEFVKDGMSEQGVEILLMVIPVLAFGLQFLAFFYFETFLIVAGSVLVLVTLVVLLFKLVVGLVKFLGEFFVGAAKAIWYIVSFKWITNQVEVLTDRDTKPRKRSRATGTNCENCKYCSTISKPGVAYSTVNVLYCNYENRECQGVLDSNCRHFTSK